MVFDFRKSSVSQLSQITFSSDSITEGLGRSDGLLSFMRHEPHRKQRVQQLFYCFVCIRCRSNVFYRAVA
jgi:hypothetical protein